MPDFIAVTCPYCGEAIELVVDSSAGSTDYVEDCSVCCHPMQVSVRVDASGCTATVRTGDE